MAFMEWRGSVVRVSTSSRRGESGIGLKRDLITSRSSSGDHRHE